MRSNYSKALNFTIDFPDEWTVEEEGSVLSVYDAAGGSGALQFSSYQVDNANSIDLKAELEDYVSGRLEKFLIEKFPGYAFCEGNDKQNHWQYWIFIKGNTLIFASYNCPPEDVGKEDVAVKSMIESALKNAQMYPA